VQCLKAKENQKREQFTKRIVV